MLAPILLLDHGVDINVKESDFSVSASGAKDVETATAEFLLPKDVDREIRNNRDCALKAAAQWSHKDVVKASGVTRP